MVGFRIEDRSIVTSMHITSFLFANAGLVENGLLNVAGAGWSVFTVGQAPSVITGVVAGIVDVDVSERDTTPTMSMTLTDPDDRIVKASSATLILDTLIVVAAPGLPGRVPFVIPFSVVVTDPLPVSVTALLSAEDGPLSEQTFQVVAAL